MHYKRTQDKIFLRLDKGEEIVESILQLCKQESIAAGSLTGIGATGRATIGFFETATKTYHKKEVEGDFEIAPLCGNITTMGGEPYLHCHITLAGKDNRALAGHLNSAIVSATCEIFITVFDEKIERELSEEIGLNLLKFA